MDSIPSAGIFVRHATELLGLFKKQEKSMSLTPLQANYKGL
jgi:hypothetical protein